MGDVVYEKILGRISSARKKLRQSCWQLFDDGPENVAGMLPNSSPYLVRLEVKKLLEDRIVITPNLIAAAEKIIDHFEFYAKSRYPSGQEFARRLHLCDAELIALHPAMEPICITGLSGVGKSTLVRLLIALLDQRKLTIEIEVGTFPLTALDVLKLGNASIAATVVSRSSLTDPAWVPKNRAKLDAYMRAAYASGLLGFCVDEFQFATSSSNANAKVTNILLGLCSYGVPWFYVCNYSLLKKLLGRNHEDRARILANIHRVDPISSQSDEGPRYVRVLLSGLEDKFDIDSEDFCRKTIGYSGGLARNISHLLSIACGVASNETGDFQVTGDHIDAAYRSEDYSSYRADVEALNRTSQSRANNKRTDLNYPPELGRAEQTTAHDGRAFAERDLERSLTRREKQVYDEARSRKAGRVVALKSGCLQSGSRKENLSDQLQAVLQSTGGSAGKSNREG
jgi:energy-coupling factor transporter ATP-binding protein EcfA2